MLTPHTHRRLLQKAGSVPNHRLACPRDSDPRVIWPGVNHLLGVSLGPIGCLRTQPSGLKPKKREGDPQPASAPPARGNGVDALGYWSWWALGKPPS